MLNNYKNIPKVKKSQFAKMFSIALFLIIILSSVLCNAQEKTKEKKKTSSKIDQTEAFYRFVDLFNEVYLEIQNKYVEEVDPEDLFQAAINGMFLTLDSHSQFLDTDSLKQLEKDTEGEFSGIGIHITINKDVLTVVAPIPGSPSAKLGIRPWDRIIEIEGESTQGITLIEAVKKLTGPPGTKVTVTIYREGETEPLYYTITRETIRIESVYSKMLDDGIGYVRLAKFSENSARDLKKALINLKDKGMKGLILDLRYNTGGLLKEAVDVAELFVPKGELIVSTKGRIASQNSEYRSKRQPIIKIPMLVLINHSSASASEIVAGAIKDLKLGVVVGPKGQKTFGKGSVQTIEDLQSFLGNDEKGNPKRCALRLTTAKYYTPNGTSIHNIGITPDIEIAIPAEQERELEKRGLLGDPNMDEESSKKDNENKKEKTDEGLKSEEKITSPSAEIQKDSNDDSSIRKRKTSSFYLEKLGKPKQDKEEFKDILLEESILILKSVVIINDNKKS